MAGQWLDTFVPGQPKPGGFTITSSPSLAARQANPYLELAVQDAPENPVAAWLWRPENEILGEELSVRIGGSFVLPTAKELEKVKRIILVAGGVGINPLVSMLGYLAELRCMHLEVHVLYSSKLPSDRNLKSILFLERIAMPFRDRDLMGDLKLFLTDSGAEGFTQNVADDLGIEIQLRRMTAEDVTREIRGSGAAHESLAYVCGPPSMTDEFVEALTLPAMAHVIEPSNVKKEKWW